MTLMQIGLDDKYRLDAKRIYLSGTQALVRLPMLQRERDRAQGLNTAGFHLRDIAVPRSACTTTPCGAQSRFCNRTTSPSSPASMRIWRRPRYGAASRSGCFRAPRSMACSASGMARDPASTARVDALKHANSAGSARNGGVLALAGDDHGCQSSTLAHQSEQVFAAALMPVLNPATLQDYLDLGLLGFALSRFSGCWVGFKAISETVESSASIYSDPARVQDGAAVGFRDAAGRPLASAGPTRRWNRSDGCMARRWTPSRRSPAPTSSIESCSTANRPGSASSPPARPISTCGRPWPTSALPNGTRNSSACASTRSR